jgi:hypothetical protein
MKNFMGFKGSIKDQGVLLATARVLKGRNMSNSSECKICGIDEDTWDHALLHCIMSRCVWALMDEGITELLSSLSISDPKHWVFHMCVNIMEDGIRILITYWAIWHARRKSIYEGKFQSPLATMGAVNRLINEPQISNEIQGRNSGKRNIGKRTCTWILSEPGSHKLRACLDRRIKAKKFYVYSVFVFMHLNGPAYFFSIWTL